MPRLTNSERQQRFKDKKNSENKTELRGIWLTPDEKVLVRKLADKLIRKRD